MYPTRTADATRSIGISVGGSLMMLRSSSTLVPLLVSPCRVLVVVRLAAAFAATASAAFCPSAFVGHTTTHRCRDVSAAQQWKPLLSLTRPYSCRHGTNLFLAKKKRKSSSTTGKGFGIVEDPAEAQSGKSSSADDGSAGGRSQSVSAREDDSFLSSVAGGSGAIPTVEERDTDEDISDPEERAKRILREKYGMRSMEEQQVQARWSEVEKQRQKRMGRMMEKADDNDDGIDIFKLLPPPVIKAIDTFLKGGALITGTAFVAAGIGITLEAWSKTSGNPLPDDIDKFVVDVVEPNFTTGLFVLLGFSVSLGLFSAAQLGSASAVYREDDN